MWWPIQTACGPEMVEELDALKAGLLQHFGVKVSRSTIIYNMINDSVESLLERVAEGDPVHKHWKRAPGMAARPKLGRPTKRAGQLKGKRREIRPGHSPESKQEEA
ncbi:MAG: hypothetical protein V3W44_05145 [Dehalococcoidales bacterium]